MILMNGSCCFWDCLLYFRSRCTAYGLEKCQQMIHEVVLEFWKKSKPSQQHHPLSVRLYSLQIRAPRIPGLSRPFNNLVWDRSLEITRIRNHSERSEKRHKTSNRFIPMVQHISGIPVKHRRMHETNKLKKYRSYEEKEQYPETISVKLHYLIPKYRIHAKTEKQRQTS